MSITAIIKNMLSPENPHNTISHCDTCGRILNGTLRGIGVLLLGACFLALLWVMGAMHIYGWILITDPTATFPSKDGLEFIIGIFAMIPITIAILLFCGLSSCMVTCVFPEMYHDAFFLKKCFNYTHIIIIPRMVGCYRETPEEKDTCITNPIIVWISIIIYGVLSYFIGAALVYGFLVANGNPHMENYVKLSFTFATFSMMFNTDDDGNFNGGHVSDWIFDRNDD